MYLLTISGDKHYSGPIRALTKWETGVEIDIQSTLGPRSRPSANGLTPVGGPTSAHKKGDGHGNGNRNTDPFDADAGIHARQVDIDDDSDSKFGISPYLDSSMSAPIVTITSAASIVDVRVGDGDSGRGDDGPEWVDLPEVTASRALPRSAEEMDTDVSTSTKSGSEIGSGSQGSDSTVTRRTR